MTATGKILLKLCFIFVTIITTFSLTYHRQIITSQYALCLDGSPSAIYVSKGDPNKILLHFESGGWCGEVGLAQTLESCYQRSLTSLGSSKKLPASLNFNEGIISNLQPNYFTNWTKIFLNYCDGAGHQGNTKDPIKYKNTFLYFRGTNITLQRFAYLQSKYGLYSKAQEVVLTGSSAGGLATFFWANHLATKVTGKFWAIACSGIFLNSLNFTSKSDDFRQSYTSLLKLSNQDIDPPNEQCVKQHSESKQLCMFAQNIIKQITVPIFVVQSLYDRWSINYILDIPCVSREELSTCSMDERSYIEQYRRNTSNIIHKLKQLPVSNGYWANGCVFHGYIYFDSYNSKQFSIPMNSVNIIDNSIQQWVVGGDQYHQDEEQWPNNRPCSNFPQQDQQ